jgi:pyruvate ferredoxin oxidoreductase gamma subunit
MVEIRWHGRGGQGAVTAAKLLAASAMREGKSFQAFPEFGPERRGAPVQAFTRISEDPVRVFSSIHNPDVVVVLDSSLVGQVPFTDGLKENGILVVNFPGTPAELRERIGLTGRHVFTVNASEIAMRNFGRAITNTPMIGALIKASGVVKVGTVADELRHLFGEKLKASVVDSNIKAVTDAFEEVQEG